MPNYMVFCLRAPPSSLYDFCPRMSEFQRWWVRGRGSIEPLKDLEGRAMWVQAILGDPTALVGHLCDVAQSAGSIHPAAVVMHYSHAPPPPGSPPPSPPLAAAVHEPLWFWQWAICGLFVCVELLQWSPACYNGLAGHFDDLFALESASIFAFPAIAFSCDGCAFHQLNGICLKIPEFPEFAAKLPAKRPNNLPRVWGRVLQRRVVSMLRNAWSSGPGAEGSAGST